MEMRKELIGLGKRRKNEIGCKPKTDN